MMLPCKYESLLHFDLLHTDGGASWIPLNLSEVDKTYQDQLRNNAGCSSVELWVSGMGAECSQYEENKWCTTDGGYGPGSSLFLAHSVFLWHAADFQPAQVFVLIVCELVTPELTEKQN